MSKQKKKYVGKIGYCKNSVLGITGADGKPLIGGHYVYIREMNGNKCNVNIITSLEDKRGYYDFDKLDKARKGYLYPLPKTDAGFYRWSAINLDGNKNNVHLKDVQDIGKIKIKHRHKWFVGKFTKK